MCLIAAMGLSACSPSDDTVELAPVKGELPTPPPVVKQTWSGGKPAKMLSEYGFFSDLQAQTPAEGVIAYEINTPHFSDYARVRRFMKLPAGEKAMYDETGVFDLPIGTILIQTMSYPRDRSQPEQGERLIETRLLIRNEEEWEPVPYKWDAEMTDAKRSVAGGFVDVDWIHDDGEKRELKYLIPNSNDCKRCHELSGKTRPMGLLAWNMSDTFPSLGHEKNQLVALAKAGVLGGLPDDPAAIPSHAAWDDPEAGSATDRARAWLAANCSHCHNPKGPGAVSGLDLSIEQTSPVKLGIFKPPVAAGQGSAGLKYSIHPGRPDESFMITRLKSVDPAVMMPPLGRRTSSEEGVALVSAWIAEMKIDEDEAERLKIEQQKAYDRLVETGEWEPSDEAEPEE